jgi:hypothetical protein
LFSNIFIYTSFSLSASKLEPGSGRPDGLDGKKIRKTDSVRFIEYSVFKYLLFTLHFSLSASKLEPDSGRPDGFRRKQIFLLYLSIYFAISIRI